MVAKKKAIPAAKKLKLKKETIKDLDVGRGKRIKGGALVSAVGCRAERGTGTIGIQTVGCGGGTGTIGIQTYRCEVGSF